MSYKFLEHGGEEGILGEGKTLESAFSESSAKHIGVGFHIKCSDNYLLQSCGSLREGGI